MLVTVSRCPLLAYQLHHPPLALTVNLPLRNFLRSFVLLLSLSVGLKRGREEGGSGDEASGSPVLDEEPPGMQ